ncbi:hypothetical protein BGZ76_007676 [Entomortierella beljakovae]|nr:hypothetical protein BGZ76_007676 [Entomortierella beljakovae]
MQILIKSIATITYQEPSRINITLKFDSPQYTLLQYFNGAWQSVMPEVMSSICRSLFNDEPEMRFQYQMGLNVINTASTSKLDPINHDPDRPCLWTAEDIFTLSPKIQENTSITTEKGLCDDLHRLQNLLGWTDGYNIMDEFKRLRFNDNLWSVVDLNEDFNLSPTYAERFVIPKSLLGSGGSSKNGASTSRSDSVKMFMKQLVTFRASQRFPIISWKSPEGGLVILRSSQPMVGIMGTRGAEDEMYVRTVLNTAAKECRRPNVTPMLAATALPSPMAVEAEVEKIQVYSKFDIA